MTPLSHHYRDLYLACRSKNMVVVCSGVTGRGHWGQSAPQRLLTGKFLPTYREKKRQGKQGKGVKIEKKRRKILKGKMENWKWKVEKLQNEEKTFSFFIFLSLFKTIKICFRSTKAEILYREKAFHAGKKIRKNYFAPSENFFLLCPWW